MESAQWGHFDNRMPFCVDEISVFNEKNELLAQKTNNHQTRISFKFDEKSKEMVVQIIDKKTDKVIRQIPPEEFLKIKMAFKELIRGTLLDKKA
jgi:flagellar protein FlaG